MPLRGASAGSASWLQSHFRCSFTAILPCCSAAWPALLPLSTFTAFLGFYCLCRSAAWPAPLPLSTFAAFLGFYCLCRLLLNQSTVADFVDLYCLCRLLLPLSTSTAFVGFHCLCLILLSLSAVYWLWLLDVETCWSDQLFCFETWLPDSNEFCRCIATGPL